MKCLFVLGCVSMCLVGCKTPNRMPMADYNHQPEVKYAPVSIIVNDGHIASSTTSSEYVGKITVVDPSTYCILSGLQQCGLFEYVDANNAQAETVFIIRFDRKPADHLAEVSVKLMGSMLTMFMVPLPYDFHYSMTVDVRHKNDIIASYRYEEDLRDYVFLLEHVFDDYEKIIAVMVSKFCRDLQVDGVLDPYAAQKISRLDA